MIPLANIYQNTGGSWLLLGVKRLETEHHWKTFRNELDRGYETGIFSFRCGNEEYLIVSPNTGAIRILYEEIEQ